MRKTHGLLSASIAALTSCAASAQDLGAAGAQVESVVIEDIVVTARRKSESGQQVPVAITAVNQAQLTEQSVVKVEDLPRLAPGLTVASSPRGSSSPNYMIRGQRGAQNPTVLTDPAVAIYFAEVPLAHASGTNQSLFDLGSVQVLKGPQGTLFGRNSTAGAILIEPQAPVDRFEGYGMASAGNYEYRDVEGVVNLPMGETIALRAGGKVSRRDGYLKNLATGQDLNDVESGSYRLSLSFKPNERIESTFIGTHFKSEGAGSGGKFAAFEPAALPLALPAPFRAYLTTQLNNDLAAEEAVGRFRLVGVDANRGVSEDSARSIQNNTVIQLTDAVALKNIIAYRKVETTHSDDFTGSGVDLFYSVGSLWTEQLTDELQLQGQAGGLDYVAGLFYFDEDGADNLISKQLGELAAVAPNNFPVFSTYDVDVKSKSYAGFVHANYDLDALFEGLSVSAGARLTRDERSVVYHNIGISAGPAPHTYTCSLPTPRPIPNNDRSSCAYASPTQSTTEPTYDVSLNYEATENTLLYVAHRRGYRSGSFNQSPAAINLAVTQSYDPEFVKDLEVGLKSDFDIAGMPARLNVASYYQWYSDIQRTVSVLTSGTALVSVITNAAKATIYGGEAEFTLRPTPDLSLTAGYSFTKPKYDEWNNLYRNSTGGLVAVDVSSSPFANVPKHQFTLTARYDLPVPSALGQPALLLSYFGQSKVFTSDIGPDTCEPAGGNNLDCLTRSFTIDSYQLLNARLSWKDVAQLGFDVDVFVNNATDEYYFTSAVNAIANLGTASAYQGAPRMYGVSIRVPFGEQ